MYSASVVGFQDRPSNNADDASYVGTIVGRRILRARGKKTDLFILRDILGNEKAKRLYSITRNKTFVHV